MFVVGKWYVIIGFRGRGMCFGFGSRPEIPYA